MTLSEVKPFTMQLTDSLLPEQLTVAVVERKNWPCRSDVAFVGFLSNTPSDTLHCSLDFG